MTQKILQLIPLIISSYNSGLTTKKIAFLNKINIKTVLRVLKRSNINIRKSKKNLLGQTFGRLKVINFLKSDKNYKAIWNCKCFCGNFSQVRASDLLNHKVNSCGCLRKESSSINIQKAQKQSSKLRYKGIEDLSGRYLSSIKYNAFKRKLEYNIDITYIWDLFLYQNRKCALTGLPINFHRFSSLLQTASLDRIDSSKGYIPGNVQWVHKDINYMKQSFTINKFFEYCRLVINYIDKNKNLC